MCTVPTIALLAWRWNFELEEEAVRLFSLRRTKGTKKAPVQYRGRKYGANDRG